MADMESKRCIVSELSSDVMTRSVQLKLYDSKSPNGELRDIKIVDFNTRYKFKNIYSDCTSTTGFSQDESYMVLSARLSTVVDAFRYFDLDSLKTLCNYHSINPKRYPSAKLRSMMAEHVCDTECSEYVYVFRCAGHTRSSVLEKFCVSRVTGGIPESGSSSRQIQAKVVETSAMTTGKSSLEKILEDDSKYLVDDGISEVAHLDVVEDSRKLHIIKEWQTEMSTGKLALVTCAVCSIRISSSKSKVVHANSINFEILRNEDLPGFLLPTTYDVALYRFALLDPNGLEFKNRLGRMRICDTCLKSLSTSSMPKFALSNWLYYGRDSLPQIVKDAFTNSSVFERMLICRARANSVTCRFNSRAGKLADVTANATRDGDIESSRDNPIARARRGVRGNILVTPLDTLKMNDIIPPPANFIRDTMSAIFVGREMPSRVNIQKYSPVLVRRSRVKTMIEFLLNSNPHYGVSDQFKYSASNMGALVDGGDCDDRVPSAVYIGCLSPTEALSSATSDYTDRNTIGQKDVEEDDDLLMENVAYTTGDHSPLSYQQMKNVALEHCLAGKPYVGSGAGSEIIPDFRNKSLLTWLFPHLDPWGIGGFFHPKRKPFISLEDQLRHLLMIDDDAFESDPEFAFTFYNVLRKSSVSQAMRFTVPIRTHLKIINDLLDLDPEVIERLNEACKTDPYYKPANDAEMDTFKCLSSVRMISRRVPGSDGYKKMLRNEIRGLMNFKGAPTLFITLNPSDVDNPIVRLLAGENISLEDVTRGEDLNKWKRSLFAAKNPSACARFFDLMITNFIKIILRHGRDEDGLYGRCTSYYGTVEAQGKGTLHCHLLVWLEGHVSPQRLKDLMSSSDIYSGKFLHWLESIIHCEFPGSTGVESQKALHPQRKLHHDNGDPHPGVISPPLAEDYSTSEEFWKDYTRFVETLIHHYGWHEHTATCWKYLERGEEKSDKNCRVGMNGETRETSGLEKETREIYLRRHHPSIVSHTDTVLFLMRCNMDIKYVGTGDAAKAFVYYVTDYITKASLSVHAGMAVLLHMLDKLKRASVETSSEIVQATRAVTAAVNHMMGRQEISHPQVMSYLVGGGDHYKSDKFAVLQWSSFRQTSTLSPYNDDAARCAEKFAEEGTVSLILGEKAMTVSNQRFDYTLRSSDAFFESLCLYDFAATSSKAQFPKSANKDVCIKGLFLDDRHPQYSTHYLLRGREYKIPVLLGPRIPDPSRSKEAREEWSRDMMLLFKPWRNSSDLKSLDQSWTEAYNKYERSLPARHRKIISNMVVASECAEARDTHREKRKGKKVDNAIIDDSLDTLFQEYDDSVLETGVESADVYNPFDEIHPNQEEGSECCRRNGDVVDEETYLMLDGCYPETNSNITQGRPLLSPQRMTEEDGPLLATFIDIMKKKKKRKAVVGTGADVRGAKPSPPQVEPISQVLTLAEDVTQYTKSRAYAVAEAVEHDMGLRDNKEQLRAFRIVADHIIEGRKDQLLMHVSGVGGTGKSHVIKAIVLLFEKLGKRDQLILGAPTGIASVLINGQTLHSLIMSSPNRKSNDISALADIWRKGKLLIVDEVSMVSAPFLSDLSSRIKLARGDHIVDREKPFGGINVVFMGDFAQLKPVKDPALYASKLVKNQSFKESCDNRGVGAVNGAFLWRQVENVVELVKNQRHEGDPKYAAFLDRLRIRQCIPKAKSGGSMSDLEYISTRLMSNFSSNPEELKKFWDAPIIVGSKALRDILNVKLIKYHSRRLHSEVATYFSRDILDRTPVKGSARDRLWNLPSSENKEAFGKLPLFIGMKVMITGNLAFDNGIVNGSEGTVTEIRFEEDEGKRYAKVVYVKIPGCGMNIDGLENDVVPLFPIPTSLPHNLPKRKKGTFTRKQLPLMPAYAYTDFKAQGRTADRVVVDPATARGQGMYVMLSRVKSLSGLLILRWFPPSKMYDRMPQDLRDELHRLHDLGEMTVSSHPLLF